MLYLLLVAVSTAIGVALGHHSLLHRLRRMTNKQRRLYLSTTDCSQCHEETCNSCPRMEP